MLPRTMSWDGSVVVISAPSPSSRARRAAAACRPLSRLGVASVAATAIGMAVFLAVSTAVTPPRVGTATAWTIIAAVAATTGVGCVLPVLGPTTQDTGPSA